MIKTVFKIDSNQIKFINSIFGREKIIVDGKEKSNKYSLSGTDHNFKIKDNDFSIISSYNQFDMKEIKLKIYKNGDLVDSQGLKLSFKQRIPWIIIGVILGIGLYQLLKFIIEILLKN